MNHVGLVQEFRRRGCFPHQAEFAASFFAPESAKNHMLVSGPGFGKSFVTSAMLSHALREGLASRVILLAPAMLLPQWEDQIERSAPNASVLRVDRRRLRELEATNPGVDDFWPNRAVVLMSIDLAKQSDVSSRLAQSQWDFLIADEAQNFRASTRRRVLIEELLNASPKARSLLLQSGWSSDDVPLGDAAVTRWSREQLRDNDGGPLFPQVRFEWVSYRRREDETTVLHELQRHLAPLSGNQQLRFLCTILSQLASSSLFALEQSLRRMRQRQKELGHGLTTAAAAQPDAEVQDAESGELEVGSPLLRAPNFAEATDILLERLEQVATDSKADALTHFLQAHGVSGAGGRVCVLTRFVDTATYLVSLLADCGLPARVLTGRLSFEEGSRVLDSFTSEGGVLVSTLATDSPLPEAAVVVFYDLPLDPAVFDAQVGRFLRMGGRPVRFLTFTDEADSLLIERLQRKVAEVQHLLDPTEIEGVLFAERSP